MHEYNLVKQGVMILEEAFKDRAAAVNITDRLQREVAHGRDVARWVKILNTQASPELVAAALLHDIERIVNLEADIGFAGDRTSVAYSEYKKQHAQRSAEYVSRQAGELGVPADRKERIVFLILHHDDAGALVEKINDPDLNILVAADSLAFFTSGAEDMLQREGEDKVAQKIYFMIEKMPVNLRSLLRVQNFVDPQHGLEPHAAQTLEKIKEEILSHF